MTTYNEIMRRLTNKNISANSGDSDETTLIVYNKDQKEIEEALKGLKYSLHSGYGGIVIVPEK